MAALAVAIIGSAEGMSATAVAMVARAAHITQAAAEVQVVIVVTVGAVPTVASHQMAVALELVVAVVAVVGLATAIAMSDMVAAQAFTAKVQMVPLEEPLNPATVAMDLLLQVLLSAVVATEPMPQAAAAQFALSGDRVEPSLAQIQQMLCKIFLNNAL